MASSINIGRCFGFGPTKATTLKLISELIVSLFLEHYPLNEQGVNKMLSELSPSFQKVLRDKIIVEGDDD